MMNTTLVSQIHQELAEIFFLLCFKKNVFLQNFTFESKKHHSFFTFESKKNSILKL